MNERSDREAPTVPVDDAALDAIEHALAGCFEVDEDGTHRLVRADYTLDQLLQFWSGIDPNEEGTFVGYVDSPLMGEVPMYEMPGVYLTERDVIAALVAEIRRLRAPTEARVAAAAALREAADDWAGGEWKDVNFNRAGRDEPPWARQARWLRERAARIEARP